MADSLGKVSIIVPVYKVEAYLKKCVDSLVAQTYGNIEIILVDDGSPDACPQICDEYSKKYAPVHVIHTENHGLSAARNTGLAATTGDFILFIDSDDWVAPEMVEKMYYAIEINGADVCVCALKESFNEDTLANIADMTFCEYGKEEFYNRILNDYNCYGYACNKLIRKKTLGNLRFDEKLLSCEDMVFSVYLASQSSKIVQLNAQYYYYRQRGDSMTGVCGFSERKLSVIKAYEIIEPIYREFAPSLLPIIHQNYLKINLNVKGRMINSRIDNKRLMSEVEKNIKAYLSSVLKSKDISLSSKLNIILTWLMPGTILKIKQSILKLKSEKKIPL